MNELHGDEDQIDFEIRERYWDKLEEETDFYNDLEWLEAHCDESN